MNKKAICYLLLTLLLAKAEAQKGEKSLAAGVLAAISDNNSTPYNGYEYSWRTGAGLDVTGQCNITDKSSLLLQFQVTRFRGSSSYTSLLNEPVVTTISLKGGYSYQLTSSGFYLNVLIGLEYANHETYLPAALGVGKRITVNDKYFVDAGIDFTGGFVSRFNLKAIFSLLRSKENK